MRENIFEYNSYSNSYIEFGVFKRVLCIYSRCIDKYSTLSSQYQNGHILYFKGFGSLKYIKGNVRINEKYFFSTVFSQIMTISSFLTDRDLKIILDYKLIPSSRGHFKLRPHSI